MNKLSKDKRDKLILTCIAVVGAMAVIYFFVLSDMKDELATLNTRLVSARDKIEKAERVIKRQPYFDEEMAQLRGALNARQAQMPRPGEDHVWFLKIMEDRRGAYNLDISEIRNPEPWEPGILPNFAFRGVAFNVTLVGAYTDFGRFLADFENAYPYMRVQLMSIIPDVPMGASGAPPANQGSGKLRFSFRVVSLIKTQT
jgi:Tfp pilus assembly protein PilO